MISRTMTSRTVAGWIVMALAVHGSTAALAEKGTEQQREACTPDAFRLCGQFIPDADRIESCLRNAGPRLSPACRVVFYPQQANQPQAGLRERGPRDRVPLPPPPSDDDDDQ